MLAGGSAWQEKAFFLNGNLAEKRRAENLGGMAHLLLPCAARSPAQPGSRLYLPMVPAKPFIGFCPWVASWAPAAGGSPWLHCHTCSAASASALSLTPSPPDILFCLHCLPPYLPTNLPPPAGVSFPSLAGTPVFPPAQPHPIRPPLPASSRWQPSLKASTILL